MAQGVAWMAREAGVEAAIVVPDHAPQAKLDAIARLGGRSIPVTFDAWWEAMESGAFPGLDGHFVHPVRDPAVMAGNGTIGLELVEQLDAIDCVLIPWGGGGLTTGIASALAAVSPSTKVYACEPETAAPVSAALAAGEPVEVPYVPSFVDGAGAQGAAARHVGGRAAAALGCVRRAALGDRRCGAAARRAAARDRGGRRRRSRSPRRSPARPGAAASSAWSRAGTSTPTGSRRSSRDRCPAYEGRAGAAAALVSTSSSSQRSYGADRGSANHPRAKTIADATVQSTVADGVEQDVGDEVDGRRHRHRHRSDAGDREPVRDAQHPFLVLLAPAQPVVRRRRDQQRRGQQRRGQGDHVGGLLIRLEAGVERHDEQEREQHLHAGESDAELVEELDQLLVELLPLLLRRHGPTVAQRQQPRRNVSARPSLAHSTRDRERRSVSSGSGSAPRMTSSASVQRPMSRSARRRW